MGNVQGQMGGARGMFGPQAQAAAAAAAAAAIRGAAQHLRGNAPGGGSPNMFPGGPGGMSMNERMMLERRREAAREDLADIGQIKRMRHM